MNYLTPAQLRAQNLGVDLTTWTDVQLSQAIARASAEVNDYTNQSNLPVPHDFRGGTIVGETHTWPMDAYDRSPTRRVFLNHMPVIAVSSFRIYATDTQYVEVAAGAIYYEISEGWIEPTSANLTSYGLWGAAIYPAMGLSEPHSSVDYTYGRTYPVAERIYPDTVTHQWRATSGFWTSAAVTVTVSGVLRTTGYTVDRTEGTVLFSSPFPDTTTDTVDVTYTSSLHPNIAMATGIIAADRVAQKNLIAAGFPSGIRSFRVAEVQVERDLPRRAGGQPVPVSIPVEAQELLSGFVRIPLARV